MYLCANSRLQQSTIVHGSQSLPSKLGIEVETAEVGPGCLGSEREREREEEREGVGDEWVGNTHKESAYTPVNVLLLLLKL